MGGAAGQLKPITPGSGGASGTNGTGGSVMQAGNPGGDSGSTPGTSGAAPRDGGFAPIDGSSSPGNTTGSTACCSAHASVGCDDAVIQECVCKGDPRCCTEKWDDVCVALVGGLGCGTTCKTDCCTAAATPGCADATVEACVCAKNADCCNTAWDDFCVLLVTSRAAGNMCGTCN